MQKLIQEGFRESIQTKISAADLLAPEIEKATMMLVNCLISGNKIILCGNGSSAALAQLFSALMVNHFETDRPGFPAITLGADGVCSSSIVHHNQADQVFSKQVKALGQTGDILIPISPTGHSHRIIKAMEAALSRDMTIIALTGADGGEISGLMGELDIEIRVPSSRSARVNEVHLLIIHSLCEAIDHTLFPQTDSSVQDI